VRGVASELSSPGLSPNALPELSEYLLEPSIELLVQALEQLESCRLSVYRAKGVTGDAYVLPHIAPEEMAILRRLGLTRLAEPRELRAALTPRSGFVSTDDDEVAQITPLREGGGQLGPGRSSSPEPGDG
jgi:hypothetical protein